MASDQFSYYTTVRYARHPSKPALLKSGRNSNAIGLGGLHDDRRAWRGYCSNVVLWVQYFAYMHITALSSCVSSLMSTVRLFQAFSTMRSVFFCYGTHFSSMLITFFSFAKIFSSVLSTFQLFRAFFCNAIPMIFISTLRGVSALPGIFFQLC